jgi:transposase-like protein
VLQRLAPVAPKVCGLSEDAEEDLTGFYLLPPEHWTKLRSTNRLDRVNKEIGRRSDVVGIFPKTPLRSASPARSSQSRPMSGLSNAAISQPSR